MGNILNKKELKKLKNLGIKIQSSLSCDINSYGVPCRTDRFEAIKNMKEYLEIHDFKVTKNE